MESGERSQLLKTAYGLIDSYNSWDMDKVLAVRTPECVQQVYPESLQRPPMNNDLYRQYFSGVMSQFKNYKLTVLDVVEDPKRHKVCMHLKATSDTSIGDYLNEFMVMAQMTEDDKQIAHVKEFVDSLYSVDFFQRLRAHMSKSE